MKDSDSTFYLLDFTRVRIQDKKQKHAYSRMVFGLKHLLEKAIEERYADDFNGRDVNDLEKLSRENTYLKDILGRVVVRLAKDENDLLQLVGLDATKWSIKEEDGE